MKLILAAHHPQERKKRQLANPRQIESHMKSRWCPQLSRPIPTLDAILAFGLLSILSCSGTVSGITERWSEQLHNWSPCTIVHHDYKEQFSGSSEAPENRCRISWLVQLVHSEEFALLAMSWTSSVVGPWPSALPAGTVLGRPLSQFA